MNRKLGLALALAAFVAGGWLYGWQGVVLAMSMVIFWLLLQFTQVMRVMRMATQRPIGLVPSAVMLQAKLHAGMKMGDVIMLTRSLGQELPVEAQGEVRYRWADPGGNAVEVTVGEGRVRAWQFTRAEASQEAA
jgi:glucose-6-phosphate-specific signal transduction histidine kinase